MRTISNPWRVLDAAGELCRFTDNGHVWQPGGVPIWRLEDAERWAELIGGKGVPWPIIGNA